MGHTAGAGLWVSLFIAPAAALDNGYRLPPMGWSSWYGFTSHIDEVMLRDMADGMVHSGLHKVGYEHIWIDDGWAIGRDNTSTPPGHVIVDTTLFPSGMRNLSDYLHARGLKFGIYTSKGPKTCLGYQPTQPDRPGSCGYEQVDADVYAHEWQVDQVKDDGCGPCGPYEPFAKMGEALNRTGRPILYAIHSSIIGTGHPNASVANMWRTGGDLSASNFDMWTNRLDLATSDAQAALAGPGAFPNPDFLEVGYSPRQPSGRTQSPLEQRAMFTMWAALPGPLILSADLRPGASSGGIDDAYTLATLTNTEVIAVNQDPRALPMRPVTRADGLEVWQKPLVEGVAVVFFHRNQSAKPGTHVTIDASCDDAFDFSDGGLRSRKNRSLCLGQIDECGCCNPVSPRLGLVTCDGADPTQSWRLLANGEVANGMDTAHDLNVGPTCGGDSYRSVLLYPTQGHVNEMWSYANDTGLLRSKQGGCLAGHRSATEASDASSAGPPRTISVTWAQLGWPEVNVTVRDLWNHTDLGVFATGFSAEVLFHEARIYVLKRQSV
eukprot:Hpha_TRINITY_DN15341_c2_g3::TRINITY_DN15341_c2_g3_i1::g.91006::m.91006/K07407/E3.2.1.22B, galA, rafA; alpha-galactosidase